MLQKQQVEYIRQKNRNTANAIWNENLVKPGIKAEIEDRVQEAKDIIYWLAKWSKKDEVKNKSRTRYNW